MRRVDAVHLLLMCMAAAFAYLVPFELLLLSYVVLGPAHYLTEISWLHDRKFFLPHRGIAVVLVAVTVGAAFIENGTWFGVVIWLAFVVCALFAAVTTAVQGTILLIAAALLTIALAAGGTHFVILGTLLPTLIHVSLFTFVFMVLGAIRSGSKAQAVLVGMYVFAICLIIVVPPSAETMIPKFGEIAREYFGGVAPALGRVLGVYDMRLDGRITGLLAFVYTYHYLNWFIKADVIRWAEPPAGCRHRVQRRFDRPLLLRLHPGIFGAAGLKPAARDPGIPAQQPCAAPAWNDRRSAAYGHGATRVNRLRCHARERGHPVHATGFNVMSVST
jgi:hypothetical protein